MTEKNSQIAAAPRHSRWSEPWSIGAVVIAILVVTPIVAVIWTALTPSENIWPQLIATTLPRYLKNTA